MFRIQISKILKWLLGIFLLNTSFATFTFWQFGHGAFIEFWIFNWIGFSSFFLVSLCLKPFADFSPDTKLTLGIFFSFIAAFLSIMLMPGYFLLLVLKNKGIFYEVFHVILFSVIILSARFNIKVFKWALAVIGISLFFSFLYWQMDPKQYPFISAYLVYLGNGLLAFLIMLAMLNLFKKAHMGLRFIVTMLPVIIVSYLFSWSYFWYYEIPIPQYILKAIAYNILFIGTLILIIVLWWEKIIATQVKYEEEKIKFVANKNEIAENNLRILQAQLEPSFLLTTLEEVLRILPFDLEKGKAIQAALIKYLRSSLPILKLDTTALHQELTVVTDYLNLFNAMVDDPIQVEIICPDHLANLNVPPVFLLTIIESVMQRMQKATHLDSKLTITVSGQPDQVLFDIKNTEEKLQPHDILPSILEKLKTRLEAVYGKAITCLFYSTTGLGERIMIRLPYSNHYAMGT